MNSAKPSALARSFAKINLTLDVLERRDDGYHGLRSVMQTLELHDELRASFSDEPGVRVFCSDPKVPTDGRNLAWRAAVLFLERMGGGTGISMELRKRIPMEAGLGGGSSNAAAALLSLNALFGRPLSMQEMIDLAARIGSDVPFFLYGGTALVEGKGELIEPLPDLQSRWLTLVKPSFGVSTAEAYARLDEIRSRDGAGSAAGGTPSEQAAEHIRKGESPIRHLSNDLEVPAMEAHPELVVIEAALLRTGAEGSMLCGSGSAVFGFFADEERARKAAEELAAHGTISVTRTLPAGSAGENAISVNYDR